MDNNNNSFIKTDDNIVINEKCIRWVTKMNECLYVCIKQSGCIRDCNDLCDKHKICKENSPNSYNKLNKYFK